MSEGMARQARLGAVEGCRKGGFPPPPAAVPFLSQEWGDAELPPTSPLGAWVMEAHPQGQSGSLAAVKSRAVGPWSLWGQAACQASAETAYRAVLPAPLC